MTPPLVLVHGLWDKPRLFDPLQAWLGERRAERLAVALPHRGGHTRLRPLAERLQQQIEAAYGPERPIDLLGFSMGGLIGRIWLQELGGHRRTLRFFSVGSPQQGSLLALPVPQLLMPGLAEMKPQSALLRQLNRDLSALDRVDCRSYFCRWDLMVLPGWQAVLPLGEQRELPVWHHRQLIEHPAALAILGEALLES